tara:strand:- start:4021 stop:4239 length:219 start_codon:yes stop_codon:yes gene_type:complete
MKIYIVRNKVNIYPFEDIKKGFTNRKNAVSFMSKVNRDIKNNLETYKKGCIILETKDFPISRKGLINAINYI